MTVAGSENVEGAATTAVTPEGSLAVAAPRTLPIPAWLRLAFRVTTVVAPPLARRWARRLFFTPLPGRRRPEEEARLATGTPFVVRASNGAGEIAAWSWGDDVTEKNAPTVLLAHGWGGNAGQLTALVAPLRAAGFRVVALDMPAHGRSPGKQSSLIHFAHAIEAAAAHVGPIHGVIAHSFGGAATTVAMSRGLPVGRVVFVAPAADFEEYFRRFREGLGVPRAIFEGMIRDAEVWLDIVLAELAPARLAPRLSAPLLVVHDRTDREVPFDEGARLAQFWPGATLHATRGLGHVRILRDPEVATLMARFIAER